MKINESKAVCSIDKSSYTIMNEFISYSLISLHSISFQKYVPRKRLYRGKGWVRPKRRFEYRGG